MAASMTFYTVRPGTAYDNILRTTHCRDERDVMDSNESKLGADGRPIYDANGKFLKGPNYWRPEPGIKVLLQGLDAVMGDK